MHDAADHPAIIDPRGLLRVSVGRCGLSRPNCSSFSQKYP
jgi:hypothetical protein